VALLAYFQGGSEPVESFSVSPEQWRSWRELPVGAFTLDGPNGRIPAVLKRSPLGLQFFACAPGHSGFTEPKSLEHQMAQVELARGLRSAGFRATLEQPGRTPSGEAWVADVWAEVMGIPYAFEVQLSQQHWDQYCERTERYRQSGVKVVWLVRASHFHALSVARYRHHIRHGIDPQVALNHAVMGMPCIPLDLAECKPLVEGAMKVVVASRDAETPVKRLALGDFAPGVLRGHFGMKVTEETGELRWVWTDTPYQMDTPTA